MIFYPNPLSSTTSTPFCSGHARYRSVGQYEIKTNLLQTDGETPALDRTAALRHVGGDEKLLDYLHQLFAEDIPGHIEKFEALLGENNLDQIEKLAHSLKGSSLSISALPPATGSRPNSNRRPKRRLADQVPVVTGRLIDELNSLSQLLPSNNIT